MKDVDGSGFPGAEQNTEVFVFIPVQSAPGSGKHELLAFFKTANSVVMLGHKLLHYYEKWRRQGDQFEVCDRNLTVVNGKI